MRPLILLNFFFLENLIFCSSWTIHIYLDRLLCVRRERVPWTVQWNSVVYLRYIWICVAMCTLEIHITQYTLTLCECVDWKAEESKHPEWNIHTVNNCLNEWMAEWMTERLFSSQQNRNREEFVLRSNSVKTREKKASVHSHTHTHTSNILSCQKAANTKQKKIRTKKPTAATTKHTKWSGPNTTVKQFCWKKWNQSHARQKKNIKIYSDKPIKKMERNRDTQRVFFCFFPSRSTQLQNGISYMNVCKSVYL